MAIARAIPKDAASVHAVGERLRALFRGRTVIMIAHRLGTVARADHIVVTAAGRVVDSGTPGALPGRCALYRDLRAAYRDAARWRLSEAMPGSTARNARGV